MIHCPVWGAEADCPYCDSNGECHLDNPWEECDDYYAVVGDNEKED